MREEEVDVLVHLAFFTNPQRDTTHAHELESIGTLNLLAAAAAAGVSHVVMRSFTAVYGARGQNPNFLTEDQPLQPNPALPWARDKLEAEQHAASFARRYPEMKVTVLTVRAALRARRAHLLHAHLRPPRGAVLMGYDPLVQLLHPDDALAAVEAAVSGAARGGAFNIVPRGSLRLATALHLAREDSRAGAAPRGLRRVGPAVGGGARDRPRPGSSTTSRYRSWPTAQKAERELGFTAAATAAATRSSPTWATATRAGGRAGRGRCHERRRKVVPLDAGRRGSRVRRLPSPPSDVREADRLRGRLRALEDELARAKDAPARSETGGPLVAMARAPVRTGARALRWANAGAPPEGRLLLVALRGDRRVRLRPEVHRDDPAVLRVPLHGLVAGGGRRASRTCRPRGPGLIVANHSGVLPYDGMMIKLAMRHEHPARRECRMLALDMFALLPFLAPLLAKSGEVRANQENGERLLRQGDLVGVFPEGVKGVGKPFKQRYKLARFGRGGFVRLALRTGAPIVPCAVVGSEEIHPMIGKADCDGPALRPSLLPAHAHLPAGWGPSASFRCRRSGRSTSPIPCPWTKYGPDGGRRPDPGEPAGRAGALDHPEHDRRPPGAPPVGVPRLTTLFAQWLSREERN